MVRLRRDCRIKKDVNRSSYQISILEVWNSFFPRAVNCLAELNSHCKYISCSVFLIWGFLVMRINILLQTSHAWIWKDTWDVLSSKEQLILFDVQGNQLRTYQCHTLNGIGNGSINAPGSPVFVNSTVDTIFVRWSPIYLQSATYTVNIKPREKKFGRIIA